MKRRKNTLPVKWVNVLVLVGLHITTIVALTWTYFHFSWSRIILLVAVEFVALCPGVGIGLHRYATHRGFETSTKIRRIIFVFACIAAQGGPIEWISTHVLHHLHTDKRKDPHTPRRGFWHAHIGWIIRKDPMLSKEETWRKYAPQLMKDPWLVVLNRYWYVPPIAWGLFLWALFDLYTAVMGTVVPINFGLHFTWFVNSWNHLWGKKRFKRKDRSTNSWIVALLTWGEGNHNNHHEDPTSVRHARKWYDIDVSWYVIWLLWKFRLIRNLQLPKA